MKTSVAMSNTNIGLHSHTYKKDKDFGSEKRGRCFVYVEEIADADLTSHLE